MGNRVWYEACALMADATSHHHVFLVASSEEAEQRIRNHYPEAVTLLVRQDFPWTKRKESKMPLYMDIHRNVEGLTSEAVAEAHKKDLEVQDKHGVRCLHYWYNENQGMVFCLFEAPSAEAADAVHQEAHGLTADEIIEVKDGS